MADCRSVEECRMLVGSGQGIHHHQRIVDAEQIVVLGIHLALPIVCATDEHRHQPSVEEELETGAVADTARQDLLTFLVLPHLEAEALGIDRRAAETKTKHGILCWIGDKRLVLPQTEHDVLVVARL